MDRRRFLARSTLAVAAVSRELQLSARASQSRHWQPDGAGVLARIGVLTPDFDPVPESEMSAMAPKGVSIHGSRVFRDRSQTPAAFTEPRHIDAAADRFADLRPHAVVLAYTGSSYVLGVDADAPTQARLQEHTGGIPVVLTSQAATDALHALAAKRVALIHPPGVGGAGGAAVLGARRLGHVVPQALRHGGAGPGRRARGARLLPRGGGVRALQRTPARTGSRATLMPIA